MSNKTNDKMNKKMDKKTVLIASIAAAVLVAVVIGICFFVNDPIKETGGVKGISVSVVPKTGSMTVLTFATEMVYLGDALEEKGLVKPGDSSNGVVHTINGIKADSSENASWKLFVDGEEVTTGIYETKLQNGKNYRLEYTVG